MVKIISENDKYINYVSSDEMKGKAMYLALFNSWVVKYSNRWTTSKKDNKVVSIWGEKKATDLKDMAAVTKFCKDNNIDLIETTSIDHPLAHGLPNCRSIKPY